MQVSLNDHGLFVSLDELLQQILEVYPCVVTNIHDQLLFLNLYFGLLLLLDLLLGFGLFLYRFFLLWLKRKLLFEDTTLVVY